MRPILFFFLATIYLTPSAAAKDTDRQPIASSTIDASVVVNEVLSFDACQRDPTAEGCETSPLVPPYSDAEEKMAEHMNDVQPAAGGY